jgi:hypothetical protein
VTAGGIGQNGTDSLFQSDALIVLMMDSGIVASLSLTLQNVVHERSAVSFGKSNMKSSFLVLQ